MAWIECRGEVLPGYAPGLPLSAVKVQRKVGLFKFRG